MPRRKVLQTSVIYSVQLWAGVKILRTSGEQRFPWFATFICDLLFATFIKPFQCLLYLTYFLTNINVNKTKSQNAIDQ